MRKLKIFLLTGLVIGLFGCSESFLNSTDLTQKTSASFYHTPTDIAQALAACYAVEPSVLPYQSIFLLANQMSDDCLGGGGQNDHSGQYDQFQTTSTNGYESPWVAYYQGINRTNTLIAKFSQVTGWTSDNAKNQALGEAYFLRANCYFNLMRMFGGPIKGVMTGVPCFTDPNATTSLRAPVDTVYARIASDLKSAITLMPGVTYPNIDKTTLGHATKWAAEALMARVYLFYTGAVYGTHTTLPLPGGGTIAKADVQTWIADCADNSGHALIPDFRNLWPYSYSTTGVKGGSDYGYAKANNLLWVEGNGTTGTEANNTEDVFSVHYSNFGGWNGGLSTTYSNQINLYCSWRNQTQLPFGDGWGDATVVPTVYSSWDSNDLRKQGSICNVNDATEGITGFVSGSDKQWNETGYWQKKYIAVNIKAPDGTLYNYSCKLYGTSINYQTDNTQNIIYIRFADVLLMAAELGCPKAQAYFDQVHKRGYPTYVAGTLPATLANIQVERRHELAFEGIRYWDELRWGTFVADLTAEAGAPELNAGVAATYDPSTAISRFNLTKGFLQIPNDEIGLSNGQLVQNDGWTTGDNTSQYQQ
ncbi:MAG: RagB/SusD family nutrient uptake outer membrane protein [Paludibacter sp.]|nr:RagB/SusD family nutrient uptake outer membrane protein [Paludibacter sp.]